MLRKANTTVPSLVVAALLLGFAAPAFADVPPGPRERNRRTVEAQHAPPMTPPHEEPAPVEAEPPPQQAPETAVQPAPEATPPQAKPEAKADAKAATDSKSGNCSIDAGSEQAIAGVAALVMLIAGAGLRGRRRDRG